jgi:predicted DNA-binding protein
VAKKLVQTTVSPSTLRKLDALAAVRKWSRATYLRDLIEMHVRAVQPKLLRELDKARPGAPA